MLYATMVMKTNGSVLLKKKKKEKKERKKPHLKHPYSFQRKRK